MFQRTKEASVEGWLTFLNVAPYLQSSPAEPFLVNYYPDGVGMSPYYIKKVVVQENSDTGGYVCVCVF